MNYAHRLPSVEQMTTLSLKITQYPVDKRDSLHIARMWNMNPEVISFLRTMPDEQVFAGRTDIIAYYQKTAQSIRRIWESPPQLTLIR